MQPRELLPPLPHKGPPLPEGLGIRWPLTLEDVERAVRAYAESADRAIQAYRRQWEMAVEKYRWRLLSKLP
jgi:hypothetical protein